MAPSDAVEALTVEFDQWQVTGTVRGRATVFVRVEDAAVRPVLRLRRYRARFTAVRFRDLGPDGSALGPERDVETGADPAARVLDHTVDAAPGALVREYRLEWALDPRDHPSIGLLGAETLVIRAHLLTKDRDGAEQVREQRSITVIWAERETVLRVLGLGPRAPEPLRTALRALLDDEDKDPPRCETCRQHFELDRLEKEDAVWEHSAAPRWEELRALLVEWMTALSPRAARSWPGREHDRRHVDAVAATGLTGRLTAARERHLARLADYSPARSGGEVGEVGAGDGIASA